MNAVQAHLMLNHIPVLAPLLAAVLVVIGMAFRSQPIVRVALGLLVLAALIAVPVFLTGEPVEEATESLSGVSEQGIERHEGTALWSLILLAALGLIAAVNLAIYRRRPLPRVMSSAILVASLIVAGQVAWTAHLGGQIRHTELRSAADQVTPPGTSDEDD